jgi:hypothetical protein
VEKVLPPFPDWFGIPVDGLVGANTQDEIVPLPLIFATFTVIAPVPLVNEVIVPVIQLV